MDDFANKVVVITGAAGNLGSAVARAYQEHGAKMVLVDRSEEILRQQFSDLVGSPNHLLMGPVDLTDPTSIQEMVAEVIKRFGRVDILVNTVGGYRAGTPLHETPVETLDFMFNLNVRTMFLTSKAVIPYMLENGSGKILSVAARPGLAGRADMAAYSASKSAVFRLTESMSAELKDEGINVNCVVPGTIDTPLNRKDMPDANFSHWVQPESLADVILFLTSHAARDIHGAAIPVYGRT